MISDAEFLHDPVAIAARLAERREFFLGYADQVDNAHPRSTGAEGLRILADVTDVRLQGPLNDLFQHMIEATDFDPVGRRVVERLRLATAEEES